MSDAEPNEGARSVHVVDEFDGGFGWLARPDESLARCSHALRTDEGLWLLDPIDVPGIDAVLAERSTAATAVESAAGDESTVAGVAVCAGWHARDAARFAVRHDVPVTVPSWIDRPLERFDVPAGIDLDIERSSNRLPGTDLELHRVSPAGLWSEAAVWRSADRTLYVPESLGTAATFRVGAERLGVILYARLVPPRDALADFEPDRVLVGHGDGVFDDAEAALDEALAGARRRFPRALLAHGPQAATNLIAAVRR